VGRAILGFGKEPFMAVFNFAFDSSRQLGDFEARSHLWHLTIEPGQDSILVQRDVSLVVNLGSFSHVLLLLFDLLNGNASSLNELIFCGLLSGNASSLNELIFCGLLSSNAFSLN
jgi:hypothetical protein